MLPEEVLTYLPADRLVGQTLLCLDTVDSTNTELKRRAAQGAPDGLAVIADRQTGGRGRLGRSFVSVPEKGLYLSVLLRPRCAVAELTTLTAWAAVAVCDAIHSVCGVRPGIKWTNDLVLEGRKVCGILTELGTDPKTGAPDYVVLGIGVNLSQTAADFGPEVAPVAISLAQALGTAPDRAQLAAAILSALDGLYAAFPKERVAWLARYRANCITTGKPVRLLRPNGVQEAFAEAIDDDFALTVRLPDGRRETVSGGEVSVRGLFGYL